MTSTTQNKGRVSKTNTREKSGSSQGLEDSHEKPGVRRLSASASSPVNPVAAMGTATAKPALREQQSGAGKNMGQYNQPRATAIEQCVQHELRRYFDMLDGEEPSNLYRMVINQVEHALVGMVMQECRGNQTRASEWLGISRGNLRTKLSNMD